MKTHSTYSQMTLERFRPHRRRGWKRKLGCWLWTVVWMLALWAVLWWVFSALSGARPSTIDHRPSPLLHAGLGAAWLGYGVFFVVLAGVVVWSSRRGRAVKRAEDALGGRVRPSVFPEPPPVMECPHRGSGLLWAEDRGAHCDGCDEFDPETDLPVPFEIVDPLAEGDTLKREQRAHEKMPEGMTRHDAALICFALAAEARLIRDLVRSAQGSLGAEDYDDALTGAEDRLGKMRTHLWQLKAHFDGGAISESDAGELPKMYEAMMKEGGAK